MKLAILGFLVLAAGALVFCFIPLKAIAYTEIVEYEDIETYYETEPYEVQVTKPLDYEVIDSYFENDTITEYRQIIIGGIVFQDEVVEIPIQVAYVEIQNIDTVPGSFEVSFYLDDPLYQLFLNRTLELAPSETLTASCPAYTLGDWTYNVSPSMKTVTETKYRQVEKARTVTKERLETRYKNVTLLDYLLHY